MTMSTSNTASFLKLKSFYNVGDSFRGLNLFPLIAKELKRVEEVEDERGGGDGAEIEPGVSVSSSNTVFVGNIDFRVTRSTLRKFFAKFGRVTDVYIVKNHCTRTSKGIAFVRFAKKESAESAMQAAPEEATLNDRVLRIFPAEEKRLKRLRNEVNDLKEEVEEPLADAVAVPLFRNSSGTILDLDDNVMMIIFDYLNAEDIFEAENVCLRWSSLAIRCWTTKRHLSFKNCFSTFGKRSLTDGMLKMFLKRCGLNLKSLDVSTISSSMDYRTVELVAHLCPNLETLDLSGVQLTTIALRTLAEHCTQLKSITLQNCSNMGEKGLWWLLNKCQDMEYVNVTRNLRITGQCFHRAGPNIRILKLNSCFNFSSAGFEKISQRCPQLTELYLNGCRLITSHNFEMLCLNCPNISKLDIGKGVLNSISLSHLQHLTKLESLDLSHNSVMNDEALRIISQSCSELRILDISACGIFISDTGLKCLKCCSKLTTLDVSYIENITDDSLEFLAASGTFEEVRCRGILYISDSSCVSWLNLCSGLLKLDVSGCELVTLMCVETAFAVVQNRIVSGPKLELFIGGTSIDATELGPYHHPLLEICTSNLCRRDLMPYQMFMGYDDSEEDEDDVRDYGFGNRDSEDELLFDDDPVMEFELEWMS